MNPRFVSHHRVRIVIAEDQRMVLGALAALLGLEPDIDVVAQVTNGNAALEAVSKHAPDILIADIEMPALSGLEVARQLADQTATRVIILTTFSRAGYLRRALEAKACGYLLKSRPARELADAVRRVHQGQRVIDPALAAEAKVLVDPLTDRHRDVLRLTNQGLSTADIALKLGLSPGTVRNNTSEAIARLGAENRFDAARIAHLNGWL